MNEKDGSGKTTTSVGEGRAKRNMRTLPPPFPVAALSQVSIWQVVAHAVLVFLLTAFPAFAASLVTGDQELGVALRIAGSTLAFGGFMLSGLYGPANARLVHVFLVALGVWLLSFVNVFMFDMALERWAGAEAIGIGLLAAIGGGAAHMLTKSRKTS
ncbi:MAG TPA: hypothetical protein QF572_11530 [Vicinamibacterales bacterium]|jgi:hypothetical protein|nr:hypothetical protein [Vicinamibacterales bacterium]|tara:strand:+ start:897 stop:1367 length:471 start_codon:yes stop_codon:yes gene_type:complete